VANQGVEGKPSVEVTNNRLSAGGYRRSGRFRGVARLLRRSRRLYLCGVPLDAIRQRSFHRAACIPAAASGPSAASSVAVSSSSAEEG